jgi:hypothetical protein
VENSEHGAYNADTSSNPWTQRVQVLSPAAENDPAPQLKHAPELAAPVIKQHSSDLQIIKFHKTKITRGYVSTTTETHRYTHPVLHPMQILCFV